MYLYVNQVEKDVKDALILDPSYVCGKKDPTPLVHSQTVVCVFRWCVSRTTFCVSSVFTWEGRPHCTCTSARPSLFDNILLRVSLSLHSCVGNSLNPFLISSNHVFTENTICFCRYSIVLIELLTSDLLTYIFHLKTGSYLFLGFSLLSNSG